MIQLLIEDHVFAELQRALANAVRVTAVQSPQPPAASAAPAPAPTPVVVDRERQRAPKVRLSELIASGLLKRGETLVCVDYSGNPVPNGTARVATGNKLEWNGRRYFMSRLAADLLSQAGRPTENIRGPAFWRTASGKTVLDLWRESGLGGGGAA